MSDPTPAKKETSIETIKDVIFMYTSVSYAVKQLNKDKKPFTLAKEHPLADLEKHGYEIKILLPDAEFKKLKKSQKGAKNLPNAKEWEKADLLEAYGDCLNADDLEDDMVLIKFTQGAIRFTNKAKTDAVETYQVKQIGVCKQVQDRDGNTIDQDTRIGNGSKGHFQYRPVRSEHGLYLYPQTVCITHLTEFKGGGGEEDLDSLGLEDLSEEDMEALAQEAADALCEEEDGDIPTPDGGNF